MDKKYLMVRAMRSSDEDFAIFFNNSVIAVGWSDIDFSKYDQDKTANLLNDVQSDYYNSKKILQRVIGRQLNQVRRFHNINSGDYIIIPYHNCIRFAIAEDKIYYDLKSYSNDLSNHRKVQYQYVGNTFKTISRDALSEALQRRLRVRGSTVSDLFEFKEEIDKLFDNEGYSWASDFEDKEKELEANLIKKLIQKIRNGTTYLKTGGLGVEYLVKELFISEGYKTEVLPKTKFQFGDADVLAVKSDKFQETKILVQVKHHDGFTSDWGLKQLTEIRSSADYKDHKFVLISTAKFSDEVKIEAENLDIATMNGEELAEWILENVNLLSLETKMKLGLSSVPHIID